MRYVLGIAVVTAGCRGLLGFDDPVLAGDAPTANDVAVDVAIDSPVDAFVPVCPPAPNGCTVFTCPGSASCYFACTTKRSWTNARDRCATDAIGCLVTIESSAENDCIFQHTQPQFPDLVWTGLRQDVGAIEPAGGWAWECGTSTFFPPNWGAGVDPDDFQGNEDCSAMAGGAAWFDATCSNSNRYVCEL